MITMREYREAVARVASHAGVPAASVVESYRRCIKKSAATAADLFLADGVITLLNKKVSRSGSPVRRSHVHGSGGVYGA